MGITSIKRVYLRLGGLLVRLGTRLISAHWIWVARVAQLSPKTLFNHIFSKYTLIS
jgi:hypothetical protein